MTVVGMLQLPPTLRERERDLMVLFRVDGPDAVDGSAKRQGVLTPCIRDVIRADEILKLDCRMNSVYRVTLVVGYLGWVDLDLGSSPGCCAATVDTYCLSRMVEHSKSQQNQVTNHHPHPVQRGIRIPQRSRSSRVCGNQQSHAAVFSPILC